jgi:hypothetical protein
MTMATTTPGLVLESCNNTWIFDTLRRQFRRVLKSADGAARRVSTGWRPYHALNLDDSSESFVVVLNAEGTRLLRSWRHLGHCPQCDGEPTTELPANELRRALVA